MRLSLVRCINQILVYSGYISLICLVWQMDKVDKTTAIALSSLESVRDFLQGSHGYHIGAENSPEELACELW